MSILTKVRARLEVETENLVRVANWLDTSVHQVRAERDGEKRQVPIGTPLELTHALIGAGYPSGGDGGRASGHGDPTARAAGHTDEALEALRQTLADLDRLGDLVCRIEQRHRPFVPHPPSGRDRAETGKAGNRPVCASCARGGITTTSLHTDAPTTVGGRLEAAQWMCSDCYRWTTRIGRAPSRAMVAANAAGTPMRTRVTAGGAVVQVVAGDTVLATISS